MSRSGGTKPKAKLRSTSTGSSCRAVLDGNRVCRGICAMDLRTMEVRTFPADAVIIAPAELARSLGSRPIPWCVRGRRSRRCISKGCCYANGEFIQVHPTSIPGEDKLRLMSESARGEGGRVWVPKNSGDKREPKSIPQSERWYFLEEWYPKYGNLVPRDMATRAIFKVVYEYNLGIDGEPMVYLDLTHIDRTMLDRKLEGILEIYEKFVGDDPRGTRLPYFGSTPERKYQRSLRNRLRIALVSCHSLEAQHGRARHADSDINRSLSSPYRSGIVPAIVIHHCNTVAALLEHQSRLRRSSARHQLVMNLPKIAPIPPVAIISELPSTGRSMALPRQFSARASKPTPVFFAFLPWGPRPILLMEHIQLLCRWFGPAKAAAIYKVPPKQQK